MSVNRPTANPSTSGADLSQSEVDRAREKAAAETPQEISRHTARAYSADWKHFSSWCKCQNVPPLPPDPKIVAAYIKALAAGDETLQFKSSSLSTIERRLSAIGWNYARRGLPFDRADQHLVAAIAVVRGSASDQKQRKEFLAPEEFMAMLETLNRETLRGLRDRAMLLVGYAGGLKRSEIVGLDRGPDQSDGGRGWIEIHDDGLVVHLKGRGHLREIEIARGTSDWTCPLTAVRQWLSLARISHGPLFRRVTGGGRLVGESRLNDQEVARLVKRSALAAGIRSDLSATERQKLFAGQSLRNELTGSLHKARSKDDTQRFAINITRALGL